MPKVPKVPKMPKIMVFYLFKGEKHGFNRTTA